MSALAVLQTLAANTDPTNTASPFPTLVAPWSVQDPTTSDEPGGGTRITSALENSSLDETIPLGAWKLRLLHPNDGGTGVEIPFHLIYDAAENFQRLELELIRFELVSDPNMLTAAHLRTDPNTHLEPQFLAPGSPAPVTLFGPDFTLILSGPTLDGIDARFGGAPGGAAGENFPSIRFEPPHFLAGGPQSDIGIVCDEVTLDLSRTANPPVVNEFLDPAAPPGTEVDAGAWQGVHLVELGIFIGDGSQVGTWSGMAAMRDFFIDFDGILSGTFIGELVHQVVDTPGVVITIRDDDGDEVDDSDVSLPAPDDGTDYRRVHLSADASWSGEIPAAGLRPTWTVPSRVHVEEPRRRTSMTLGWVRVPADGETYTLSVAVRDHRLGSVPETSRSITVAAPTATGGAAFDLVVEGVPQDTPEVPGTGASQRLHMGLLANQTAVITARSRSASSATLSLTDTAFVLDAGAVTQNFTNGAVEWTVRATPAAAVGTHGAVAVTATDGTNSRDWRLRMSVNAPVDTNGADFELISYTDWRAEPGIGLARFRGYGGVDTTTIDWRLSSRPATAELLTDVASDALFTGTADPDWVDETIRLANSGGTVRPFLHAEDRLWRLTGTADPAATTTPNPILVGEHPDDPALLLDEVRTYVGPGLALDLAATGSTIRFHYDCDHVLANPGDCSPGVGVEPLDPGETQGDRFDRYTAEQVQGFIALYQTLAAHIDAGITSVGLFGFASAEGPPAYNADLAARRAASVEDTLRNPASIAAAMSADGFTAPADLLTAVAGLTFHVSSAGAQQSSPDPADYPSDRRVFAVIKPAPISAPVGLERTEYFVTLPGAPNPTTTPEVPEPKLQEHPFHHAMFRRAYTEVELLRNELVRLQVQLKLDFEAFNENDLTPEDELNPVDGVTTLFLEMIIDEDTATGETDYSWELAALADPADIDGFAVLDDSAALDIIGGPAVTTPAITALVGGGRVDMAGFLAAVGLGAILRTSGVLLVRTLIWQGIRATIRHSERSLGGFTVAFDYTVTYDIDVDVPLVGHFKTDQPTKLMFRNVGVEITHDPAGDPQWQGEFFYSPDDGFAIDIDDPGVFRAGDGLGRLLQVRRVAAGAGSPFWTEFEFGLAFDTGIVSLDTIRVRIALEMDDFFTGGTIEDFSFSINKIGASVDIPGAIGGSGLVELSESTVAGELDLSLIPLELRVMAGFKFVSDPFDAFYGFLGVEFAPGIPVFNTGAALYGLHGLLGVNMGRTNQNALQWYQSSPIGVSSVQKWQPDEGAWAIGVGAVVGTVYDLGFTWNTKGTFLFELPGPKFTLATLSNILSPKSGASDAAISATIVSIIMLDFENDTFLIALDFVFDKSPVITFRVPAELYFNMADGSDWHVRFGQWEPASKRIEMRILDLWSVTGYLQIEGKELSNGKLQLAGVAIGTGGRVEIAWGVKGVLYLLAYFEFHIGVQFEPFMLQGVVAVGGELQVGPVSLSAKGELRLITPNPFVIQGEICGCISFFFFDVCGCADFEIGDGSAAPPPPKPPFDTVKFIDRLSAAVLVDDDGEPLTQEIPIDAVLHVLFDQDMQDRRPDPAGGLSASNLRNQVSNDLWFAYGLTSLDISPAVGIYHEVWAPYSVHQDAADAESNRTLRVFDWVPQAHGRALDFAGGYGNVLTALVDDLCRPIPEVNRDCATFDDEALGAATLWELETDHLGTVRVFAGQFSGPGSDLFAGSSQTGRTRVVHRVPIDYADRVAEIRSLELARGRVELRISLHDLYPEQDPPPDPPTPPTPPDRFEPPERIRPPFARSGTVPDPEWLAGLGRTAMIGLTERIDRLVFATTAVAPSTVDLTAIDADATVVPTMGEAIVDGTVRRRTRPGDTRLATSPIASILADRAIAFDSVNLDVSDALSADLVDLQAEILGVADTGQFDPAAVFLIGLMSGYVFVSFDPLVEVEATFITPAEVSQPGEVIFLDAALEPVSPVIDIFSQPAEPSTGFGPFAEHDVRKVRFGQPDPDDPDPPAASWMVIHGPLSVGLKRLNSATYLNEVCGVTLGEWRARAEAAEGRRRMILQLEQLTGIIGGEPAVSAVDLLKPNTTYSVSVGMEWERFRSATASEIEDADVFPDDGITFRTAAEPPTSVDRYVAFTDPIDDQQPHYYTEPTEITFVSRTLDQMFDAYGQQLVARAKSALGSHTLLQPITTAEDRFLPLDSLESTLYDALSNLDPGCAEGDWEKLFEHPVLTFAEPLMPNTGYTVSLIPRPLGESSWPDNLDGDFAENRHVFRFDLTTSRWPTFTAHVDAYRNGFNGDVLAGPAGAADAHIATLAAHNRSDAAIDALHEALFGGPLALADAPAVHRLWGEEPVPPQPFALPTYRPLGVLVDGPEPLWKLGGGASPDLLAVEVRRLADPSDPFNSGVAVAHKTVVGDRGTRLYLLFDPPPDSTIAIRLTYRPGTLDEHEVVVVEFGVEPTSFGEDA